MTAAARLLAWALIAIVSGHSNIVRAQTYPDRPVRIIVPFPAGGGTDALSRILAEALAQRLGQRFVVENISGAGGNLGAARVANSEADGYSLLIGSMGVLSVNPLIYRNTGTAVVDKLVPISLVFETGHLIVVNPRVEARSLTELAALAKSEGGKLTYASGGIGTSTHLYAELFNLLSGSSMTHVPYRGNGPALLDVIAGHAQIMFDQIGNSSEQVRAGKVRGLAVTTPSRLPIIPDVPTTAEIGMPQLSGTSWTMLMAPSGTSTAILGKLNAAIAAITADPVMRDKMESIGASARASSSAEAAALMRSELERWKPVVAAVGLQAN
ncbi:tripartite tricarboxylate transporter substrate binding protein [Bosea sp. LjRoot9]|uniref:Bug family tripartite tricarboxylate transporter substrate binding protein n=1 Tax=Bosea sp. LjRoot9 TaxID=3342341 RepID=UPI003ECEBF15